MKCSSFISKNGKNEWKRVLQDLLLVQENPFVFQCMPLQDVSSLLGGPWCETISENKVVSQYFLCHTPSISPIKLRILYRNCIVNKWGPLLWNSRCLLRQIAWSHFYTAYIWHFLAQIRQTRLQYMTETERLNDWVYLYDNCNMD